MVYSLLNIATTFSNMFTIQLGKQIWQSSLKNRCQDAWIKSKSLICQDKKTEASFQYYTDEIPKNNDIYHASKPRQIVAH